MQTATADPPAQAPLQQLSHDKQPSAPSSPPPQLSDDKPTLPRTASNTRHGIRRSVASDQCKSAEHKPRVTFNDTVEYHQAMLLNMQGLLHAHTAGLLDLPPLVWDYTGDSAVKLLRTSHATRQAVQQPKANISVRLNHAFWSSIEGPENRAARVHQHRVDVVMQELLTTSAACNITTLELRRMNMTGIEDGLATAISRSTGLTRLNLEGNDINPFGCTLLAEALRPCTRLTTLNLSGNHLGNGLGSLSRVLPQLPALADLMLRHGHHLFIPADHVVAALATALSQCTSLTRLDVSDLFGLRRNLNGPAGAETLLRVFPQCTRLAEVDLSSNQCDLSDDLLLSTTLARCPALKRLNLKCCKLKDASLQALGTRDALTALTHLNLSENVIRPVPARSLVVSLPACTALAVLRLAACTTGSLGPQFDTADGLVVMLAPVLPMCRALRHLDLDSCDTGPVGCASLAAVLPQCASLTRLDMNRSW
jgi:Ran GTPase-activating protein (RanGAP) involved in mRNA processing and transport